MTKTTSLLTTIAIIIAIGIIYYVTNRGVQESPPPPVILPPAAQELPQNALDDVPALRETECLDVGPACPSTEVPVCQNGQWYCREFPPEGIDKGAQLNVPAEKAFREGCPDPGLACEVPKIPECLNGKWLCIGPAEPAG